MLSISSANFSLLQYLPPQSAYHSHRGPKMCVQSNIGSFFPSESTYSQRDACYFPIVNTTEYYWVVLLWWFALWVIKGGFWMPFGEWFAKQPSLILLLSRHTRIFLTWQVWNLEKELANIEHKVLSTNCQFYFGSKWPCIFQSQLFTI